MTVNKSHLECDNIDEIYQKHEYIGGYYFGSSSAIKVKLAVDQAIFYMLENKQHLLYIVDVSNKYFNLKNMYLNNPYIVGSQQLYVAHEIGKLLPPKNAMSEELSMFELLTFLYVVANYRHDSQPSGESVRLYNQLKDMALVAYDEKDRARKRAQRFDAMIAKERLEELAAASDRRMRSRKANAA